MMPPEECRHPVPLSMSPKERQNFEAEERPSQPQQDFEEQWLVGWVQHHPHIGSLRLYHLKWEARSVLMFDR